MPSQIVNTSLTTGSTQRRAITLTDVIEEGATASLAFTHQAAGGGSIPNTDLQSVTLTLFDEESHAIINSRQDQDVLGAGMTGQNNVAITATSDFTLSLQIADNIVYDPTRTKTIEYHRARFEITYTLAAQTEVSIIEFRFPVRRELTTVLTT